MKYLRLPNGKLIDYYNESINDAMCIIEFINKDYKTIKEFFGTDIINYIDILDEDKNIVRTYDIYAIMRECVFESTTIQEIGTKIIKEAYTEIVPEVIDEATNTVIELEKTIEHEAETEETVVEIPVDLIKVKLRKPRVEDEVNNIKKVVGIVNPNNMTLDEYKDYYISLSNDKLADYLLKHPLVSTCHGNKEGIYNITKAKQDLMTSNYITYTVKKGIDPDAILTWNESGEECETWTEEEYLQLVIEIEAVVKPLVAHQQSLEKQITSSLDIESVKAISLDYSVADIRNSGEQNN